MAESAFFIGGPWDGQMHNVDRWPLLVPEQTGPRYYEEPTTRLAQMVSNYRVVEYRPLRHDSGAVLGVTLDVWNTFERTRGIRKDALAIVALKRLHDAVTSDLNDPDEDSEQALTAALELAEDVLHDQDTQARWGR